MQNKLNKIMEERGAQYGSFEDNVILISMIKRHIDVVEKVGMYFIECLTTEMRTGYVDCRKDVGVTTIEFARNILALKAVRSLTATGDNYKDCIYDFVNYKALCERVLKKLTPKELAPEGDMLILDPLVFNEDIHSGFSFILKKDKVYEMYNQSDYSKIDIIKE